MGSSVSPIVCNLYMEDFEQKALATSQYSPEWWRRYVDDTHTVLKKAHSQQFTDHLNSIDDDIKWTTEGEEIKETTLEGEGTPTVTKERCLAFLDTVTVVDDERNIKTRVYRKNTHTDQYLNFMSNHPIEHKIGVVRTLMNRAEAVVSDEGDLRDEKQHIRKALQINGYPKWAVDKGDPALKQVTSADTTSQSPPRIQRATAAVKTKRCPAIIPYIKGVSEELRRAFHQYNIPAYFKPCNTLRQLLVRPKDKVLKDRVIGPVYNIECDSCSATYIGETERSLKARFQEHKRRSSETSEVSRHIHVDQPGHSVEMDSVKILDIEPRWFERGVKEAIHIRVNKPSLNRDGGRYQLPSVWNNILDRRVGGGGRS